MSIASDPPPAALAWVARALGGSLRVRAVRPLAAATSASMHALRVEGAGRSFEVVLRRFTRADWLAREPDLAAREARALEAVRPLAFPTPELLAVDESAACCDVPALLMSLLPGAVRLRPPEPGAWLRALAAPLPVLHASAPEAMPELWYRPWYDRDALSPPAWSDRPGLWERVFERVRGAWPEAPIAPIHRDYHPANVLFVGDTVSGVVDWTNACRGPGAVDVAHCRLNLALLYGADVADAFLLAFREAAGAAEHHPLWDLLGACECLPDGGPSWYAGWGALGLPRVAPHVLRGRLEDHVARALARLQL